jgi:hypothetical protein
VVRATLLPERLRLHWRRWVWCLLGWSLRKVNTPTEAGANGSIPAGHGVPDKQQSVLRNRQFAGTGCRSSCRTNPRFTQWFRPPRKLTRCSIQRGKKVVSKPTLGMPDPAFESVPEVLRLPGVAKDCHQSSRTTQTAS